MHIPNTFLILLHLPYFPADPYVPVGGTGDDHLAYVEEMADRVEGVDGTAPPHGDHPGAVN